MKLIFLDFDGVLNSSSWFASKNHQFTDELWQASDLDPELVSLIDQCVVQTQAKIVISSSWRQVYSLEELKSILTQVGLQAEVIDCAPHYPGNKKEEDIWDWLDSHRDYEQFVIFDDWKGEFKDLLPHLVLTNPDLGVTREDIAAAIKILSSPLDNRSIGA